MPQKTLEQQEKMTKVNFFVASIVLLLLVDQAEACLNVWEEMLYPGQKLGCLNHGGYSILASGVTRFVHIVCKSLEESGCEKSGRL